MYLALIVWESAMIFSLNTASAMDADLADLRALATSFEDIHMTATDLAFFLATHNYNAVPKGDCVELSLNGTKYKLTPNGSAPGICEIAPLN
ncbi:Uncharacterised protein [uncultured archaeon]|nr:Uncharacterised protein [uncultured archaeon]